MTHIYHGLFDQDTMRFVQAWVLYNLALHKALTTISRTDAGESALAQGACEYDSDLRDSEQ